MWPNKSHGNEQQFTQYRLGIFLIFSKGFFTFVTRLKVCEQLEVGEKQETV